MADSPQRPPLLAATLAVVAAALLALAWLSQVVERTPDERNYQIAGRVVAARQPLTTPEQRFQGPLMLLGTQLTDPGGRASDDEALRRARLGMLGFPALLLLAVALWARQALGPRAGLAAALCGATSPTLLAYGPLLSSDVPLAALTALAALLYVALGWPRFVGFFPLVAGGPANGFRAVADGNCDWDQRWQAGQDALRARHPDAAFLEVGQGPRLGKVAAYCDDLKDVDPRDPARCYHWLARFQPIDRDGAAWLLFDVTPAAFAAAVARGDERAAEDLAVAQLLAGDVAAARAALALVPAERRAASHAATQSLIEAVAAAGSDAAARDAASLTATALGHFELALALADRSPRANAVRIAALLLRTGRPRDGVAFLEAAGADGSRTTEEVLLLAASLCDGGRHYAPEPMHALALMLAGPAPAADSPLAGPWGDLMARVRAAVAREQALDRDR